MATIEERMAQLEIGHRNHEEMMDTLLSIGERQQAMIERHDAMVERHAVLWIRLAQVFRRDEDDPQEAP